MQSGEASSVGCHAKSLRKLDFGSTKALARGLLKECAGHIEAGLKAVPPHPFSTSGESP